MVDKFLSNYFLNNDLIEKIKNNDYEFSQGLIFDFSEYKGSVLDFIQSNFLYFDNFDKISIGLVKYNYFFHSSDTLEISVENEFGNIISKIEDSGYNLLFGSKRNDFMSLGWIFNKSQLKLKIKKHQEYTHFISKINNISVEFIENSFNDFLNSNIEEKKKGVFLKTLELESKVQEYLSNLDKSSFQFNKIDEGLRNFLLKKDIYFLFESFGTNYYDFWKDEFLKKGS